jgi:hypothetical protein
MIQYYFYTSANQPRFHFSPRTSRRTWISSSLPFQALPMNSTSKL